MKCNICLKDETPLKIAQIRSNLRKFKTQKFNAWQCSSCLSIHCVVPEDLSIYYENYSLRSQSRGYFVDAWLAVLYNRLRAIGLQSNHSVLDYGCGHGLFLTYLKDKMIENVEGYDPYTTEFANVEVLDRKYDFVLCFDVIEHEKNFRELLHLLATKLKPDGYLVITTPNAHFIDLNHPEKTLHFVHLPCHIQLFTPETLQAITENEIRLTRKEHNDHWFMNSLKPGTSPAFFERYMQIHGNDMESAFEAPRVSDFLLHPELVYFFFFGWFHTRKRKDHFFSAFKAVQENIK